MMQADLDRIEAERLRLAREDMYRLDHEGDACGFGMVAAITEVAQWMKDQFAAEMRREGPIIQKLEANLAQMKKIAPTGAATGSKP